MFRFGALVSAFALGCGGGPSVAYKDYEAEVQHANCERLARCGLFGDTSACDTFFRLIPQTSLDAAVAGKLTSYSGEQAHACIAALSKLSCDLSSREMRTVPAACAHVFTGHAAVGDTCSLDQECKSGICDLPTTCPAGQCCPGTCHAHDADVKLGDACETNRDCVSGAYCAMDKTCTALVGVGGECMHETDCDFGLGCIGATSLQAGNCRTLPKIGEPCPYMRCAEEGARCDANGSCVAVGLAGSACPQGIECSLYGYCDAGHQCQDAPTLGMPCSSRCAGESWCNVTATPAVCAAPLDNTTPCNTDDQCATDYCEEGDAFDACADRPICI